MERTDSYRHKGLRKRLVQELMKKRIVDKAVLQAIGNVPRHLFLESSFISFAYQDKAFPIGAGQTISQPYTVALQSQLLELKPDDKILEVGTGSGYQAAVLLEMGIKLFSIERQSELYQRSTRLLRSLGYQGRFFLGDGYEGLPAHAPFDKIIVTAGAPVIPRDLLVQLKIGGIMVIPLGDKRQVLTRIVRLAEDDFEQEEIEACAFVPMLNGVVGR
ncbi:protein-L-isoaspartate(D-aspartate) O-methyltransferase [Carboxylicivirga sp. M1479]|uniref:protein-L-isoaspartate(D-aspartate) O-methyltransferase n=1 Tax=Carboxylicivirga sp. M1479 TaxID=2594476 RepID=UPI001178A92A|nr:protein-L-isoaspartate(D-aspartate) O-methyltransferase [Carboxylicivirga sp. M1479]TRX71578.1 protein-L-isoaspartate(D-aspartate) O-methyltransferase [Carboxylicivirga sp. M1479]